jgi:hypothetical protein
MMDTQPQLPLSPSASPARQPSILIIGPPGSGKTVLACSAPGRTYLLDLDGKADEMILLRKRIESNDILVSELQSTLTNDALLSRAIRVSQKMETEPQGYVEFCRLVARMGEAGADYDNWVVDPLNRVGEHLARYLAYKNGVPTMRPREYGAYLKMMEEVIDKLRKAARRQNKLFICTIHQRYMEEPTGDVKVKHTEQNPHGERTGTTVLRQMPALEGQIASKLAGYFSEVYLCRTVPRPGGTVKYIVQTVPDEMSDARTSRDLPPFVEGDLTAILTGKPRPAEGR